MRLILSLIILVAAVNIISTLVMMVLEKGRDIAILKSMGATDRSIMKIFVWCGLVIGSTGTLLGAIVGYGVCWLNITYRLIPLDPKIYYIDHLPMKVEMGDTLFVLVTAVAISFLATLYPSWKASQIRPVEGLRYE
ncbi:MAG: FtsX-like permease family protein [Deltaproteobacteria bacterium]|nr:MAG: FtsX-like permease family protein [Deltaproteobacteria bacterium]RME51157.1 MAG: FtsX-like permease family protein [Deltaproteobacteria bacterium]